jgi:hypothetical protein
LKLSRRGLDFRSHERVVNNPSADVVPFPSFQSDGSNVKTPLTESETQSNITESEDESDIQNDRKRDGSDLQNPENVKKKKIHNSEPLKTKVKGKRAFRNEVQEKQGDGNQIKGQVTTINKVC